MSKGLRIFNLTLFMPVFSKIVKDFNFIISKIVPKHLRPWRPDPSNLGVLVATIVSPSFDLLATPDLIDIFFNLYRSNVIPVIFEYLSKLIHLRAQS